MLFVIRPSRTAHQSEQGCFPSKVLAIAAATPPSRNSAIHGAFSGSQLGWTPTSLRCFYWQKDRLCSAYRFVRLWSAEMSKHLLPTAVDYQNEPGRYPARERLDVIAESFQYRGTGGRNNFSGNAAAINPGNRLAISQ